MLLMNMLLPRFLVLELILFFHVIPSTRACKGNSQIKDGLKKGLADLANAGMKQILDANGVKYNSTMVSSPTPRPGRPSFPTQPPSSIHGGGDGTSCSIDLSHSRMENLPLFLSQSEQRAFLLPSVSSSSLDARLLNFQSTLVSCPGAKIKATGQVSANIKCLNNNQLQIVTDHPSQGPDRIVDLDELECSRSIRERIQNTDDPCGPGGQGRYAHIGWYPETRRGSPFHRQISVCHDRSREHTYFANHTVYGSAIDARNIERDRPGFKEGPFYDKSEADDSYKLRNQKETLKLHLGNDQGQKVFNQRESLFLSRGHLSPDADFIYKEWQDATYYFANVAPQWQAFNNGNWKYIEQAVRKFAQGADSRIDVYTGTLGQLKLPADDGSQKKIFLGRETTEENADTPVRYANPDDFTLIPVPEFYWKIAHDPVADRAIVFIGLNNPFFEGDPEREATICPDICAEAKWFFLNQKDVGKGYSYCCSYFDFKGVIDWVPDLGAPEVLENRIVF